MTLLVMDNDGCLVDSIMEALLTAYNSLLYIEPETALFDGKKFKAKEFLSEVSGTRVAAQFRQMRPFIRSAEDYGFLLKLIERSKTARTQKEFDALRKETPLDIIRYEKAFYRVRKELQKQDYDSWYKLTPGYPGVVRGIKRLLKEEYMLAVATTNSREAIEGIFKEGYLGFNIDKKNIADKNIGRIVNEGTGEIKIDKAEQLAYLSKRNEVPFKDMIFVDDQLSHLEALGKSCVKDIRDAVCVLAGYGYTTEEQRNRAVSLNMPIISKNADFYRVIRSIA